MIKQPYLSETQPATPSEGPRTRLLRSITFDDIIGESPKMREVIELGKRMSEASFLTVLIQGETGTGKELFAQSIHNYSGRHRKPFVGINCAAIPENLLEGLLFGTTRGAFTGAVNKEGIFEQAHSGTLFLDEVNAMPISLQAKLLRAIQEKKIRRIGATEDMAIDLKIISSVNADPHQAIRDGHLRMDLFYRLGVVFIRIPPLRERRSGIETLVRHFIYKNNQLYCEQVRIQTLVKQYGTPLYVYSQHAFIDRFDELKNAFSKI